MTLTISLPPTTQARLREMAAATGKSIEALVLEAIEDRIAKPDVATQPLTGEAWTAAFNEWMRRVEERRSMYPPGYTADDSRESIYEGRGE